MGILYHMYDVARNSDVDLLDQLEIFELDDGRFDRNGHRVIRSISTVFTMNIIYSFVDTQDAGQAFLNEIIKNNIGLIRIIYYGFVIVCFVCPFIVSFVFFDNNSILEFDGSNNTYKYQDSFDYISFDECVFVLEDNNIFLIPGKTTNAQVLKIANSMKVDESIGEKDLVDLILLLLNTFDRRIFNINPNNSNISFYKSQMSSAFNNSGTSDVCSYLEFINSKDDVKCSSISNSLHSSYNYGSFTSDAWRLRHITGYNSFINNCKKQINNKMINIHEFTDGLFEFIVKTIRDIKDGNTDMTGGTIMLLDRVEHVLDNLSVYFSDFETMELKELIDKIVELNQKRGVIFRGNVSQ